LISGFAFLETGSRIGCGAGYNRLTLAAPVVVEDGAIKKVIVIGLDGLEPTIVSRLLEAGELPNLARLKEQGGFARVATTRPAQTPVAWSTFATGTNPGAHGIFDFLRRNPKTYLPELALNRYEQKNAFLPPKAVNLRRGVPIWELLGAAGKRSTVLRCPCTYPPDRVRGQMLAGMGVPDLRGGMGTATFYSSREAVSPRESEQVVRPQPAGDGVFTTHLIGPRNPKAGGDLRIEVTIKIDPDGRKVTLQSDGTPRELEIRQGQWSDWLRVKFKVGLLQSMRGMMRFYLQSGKPELALYASPVNFDSHSPIFPISDPPEYAGELAQRIGLYYTTGMVEDHAGLNNERISEEAYLDQCEIVWREREAMMLDELKVFDEGFFYCLFDTPDRIQHLFWRFTEPDHPANRGIAPSADFARVIDDCYRRCDVIVGKALEFSDENTLFIALSDHGFNSFRRGVHLNTWLYDNGFLALRDGVRPGEDAGDLLRQVDWSRTRAYAVGLGGIYLNKKGREEQGIVPVEEAEAVKAALVEGLSGLPDQERGHARAIHRAQPREAVYHGPYLEEAPDILVDFAPGYRISWSSSMGGVAAGQFEDNVKKWSGDHIIDPVHVPGVLFMNRPFRAEGARLLDLAPTILEALGVPKGPAMEGNSL
jgi:predicted AlkP superfamily phosphohydrolase/phosphomutase